MNIFESIMSALAGITGNKMRAILTMFGIVVGISSVIMITSIGEGYKQSINQQFESIGLDNISISLSNDEGISFERDDILNDQDVKTIRKYTDVVEVGSICWAGIGNAIETLDVNKTRGAYFQGVDAQYLRINKLDLLSGREIVSADVENISQVAIIEEDLAMDVFGTPNCLGEKLVVNWWGESMELSIIGILKSDSSSQMRAMYGGFSFIYCPITLTQNVFGSRNYVDEISIKVKDVDRIAQISQNVIRIIELNHENTGKYQVNSVADSLSQMSTVINIFTIFLGVVAGISLLVGGIGVMNIMLVSVTERTREIGIRKSLGATNLNIQFQFLVEAVILTALGGAVGILIGYFGGVGIGILASSMLGEQIVPYISYGVVIGVVAFSALIGIVFGVYPAKQAAKLDPIEALRFE